MIKSTILIIFFLVLTGCSFKLKDVKPWQKGTLAKESMKVGGIDNTFYKYQKHIFFSKEATKGGGGVAGGGCGCN